MSVIRKCVVVGLLSGAVAGWGQTPGDSADVAVSLGEVTVTAAPVVRKVDRDVYIPSAEVKKISDNGLSLLKNVQIPSLFVDNVMETITSGGESVQIRINGRESTIRDVKALEPSSIVRVEYLDNPGLKYKGAYAVVNFVVRNPSAGGSLMANVMQSIPGPICNQYAALKLNRGRSQWGLNVFHNFMDNTDIDVKTFERFRLRNAEIERNYDSEKTVSGNEWIYGGLFYNYLIPDDINVYVNLQMGRMPRQKNYTEGYYSYKGADFASSSMMTNTREQASYPSLSLYFDKKFARKQTLVFNTNLGWLRERSQRYYSEITDALVPEQVDITTNTRKHNFEVTAEVNYIKEWDKVSLTAGAIYDHSWLTTDYLHPMSQQVKQRQQSLYGFAELTANLGKLSLTAGFGGEYDRSSTGDGLGGEHEFIWRPRFSASYRAGDVSRFRLTLTSWSTRPSMSELSDVVIDTDALEQSVGNPLLKSYANFQVRASYIFTRPRVSFEVKTSWYRAPQAIYGYYYLGADNKVVSSYANQGRMVWDLGVAPRAIVIPDWLTLSGELSYKRYYMHGPDYRSAETGWMVMASANLSHWGFSFDANMYLSPFRSNGHTFNRGQNIQILSLSYRWKQFNFGAGVFCPFSRLSQVEGVDSKVLYRSQVTKVKNLQCLPFVSVSCNLQWGHQKRAGVRLIDAPETQNSSNSIM